MPYTLLDLLNRFAASGADSMGNVLAPAADGHTVRGSQPGPLVALGRNVATLVRRRQPR